MEFSYKGLTLKLSARFVIAIGVLLSTIAMI